MSSNFYFYSGLASFLYTIFAGAQFYTLSGVNLVSSKAAKKMIKDGRIKEVIDVRTELEWNVGHYKKAKHYPGAKFDAEFVKKFPDKKMGILTYCNSGQRARAAAEKLVRMGYKNVYYIAGSYTTL